MLQRLFKTGARKAPRPVPHVDPSERIYAVGDIHGRDDLLRAMLDKLAEDVAGVSDGRSVRIIFLGDYIDRGDHSAAVLDRLGALSKVGGQNVEFLMGNHEAAMLSFLDNPISGAEWIGWGGRQTLTSYGIGSVSREPGEVELTNIHAALSEKAQEHVPFLRSLKRYATSGDVICAHAGLDPLLTLEAQPDAALFWGQTPSGDIGGMPGCRLVHGHFADYAPVTQADRICVDTGAYYSGRLTAVRLDAGEAFIHVDVQDLL